MADNGNRNGTAVGLQPNDIIHMTTLADINNDTASNQGSTLALYKTDQWINIKNSYMSRRMVVLFAVAIIATLISPKLLYSENTSTSSSEKKNETITLGGRDNSGLLEVDLLDAASHPALNQKPTSASNIKPTTEGPFHLDMYDPVEITASTLTALRHHLLHIPIVSNISLLIQIQNVSEWEIDKIPRAKNIVHVKIEGLYSQHILRLVIEQCENLKSLSVNTTSKNSSEVIFCSPPTVKTENPATETKLETLKLYRAESCVSAIQSWCTCLNMSGLKAIQVYESIVDKETAHVLMNVFENNRRTVERLEFIGTLVTTEIFSEYLGVFENLSTLTLDFVLSQSQYMIGFSQSAKEMIPALHTFAARNVFYSWETMTEFLKGSSIQYLVLDIEIPAYPHPINLSFFETELPYLEQLDLNIKVKDGELGDACEVVGAQSLFIHLHEFSITGNCTIADDSF